MAPRQTDLHDRPYPIRRLFQRRVIPALLAALALSAGLTWAAMTRMEHEVYLELTQQRADTLIRTAARLHPDAWTRLLTENRPQAVLDDAKGRDLALTLAALAADERLVHLKIYDRNGLTLFSTRPPDIGVREESPGLAAARRGAATIESDSEDGRRLHEIYLPIASPHPLVVEVYEPALYLDTVVRQGVLVPTVVLGLVLSGLGLWLSLLVRRAQADLDHRVVLQMQLRQRLERFVSQDAAGAARLSADGRVPSRRVGLALLYSDVRDFSSLAEFGRPQTVVDFLDRLMALQIEAVRRYGGDVDKMIGDALLARFEGADREARAIAAARDILTALQAAPLERPVGIGVHDAEVILGAVGHADRQDFTVIGDGVNIAARLCSAAAAGEMVVDDLTLRRSGLDGFGPAQALKVKGRAGELSVHRWQPASQPVR